MATDFEVEEWDADFIDKLVKAEELAITTSATQTQHRHYQPHPPRPFDDISHSPPRELSQRFHDTPAAHAHAHAHALSGFASSSLAAISLEPDCSRELKIDGSKEKKKDRLKFISSKIDDKELESCHAKSSSSHYGVGLPNDNRIPPEYHKGRSSDEMPSFRLNISSKEVGVQTDDACESDYSKIRNDHSFVAYHYQKKLLDIWEENSEKKLALKLLETCGADFEVLSGYLNDNLPSKSTMGSSTPKSDMPLHEYLRSAYSADALKISHLFLILTKISNGMLTLQDLLEALMDCCRLRNGVVVHSSLRVLHVILKNVPKIRKKLIERDNFMFTGPFSEQIQANMHYQESYESGCLRNPFAKNVADQLDSQGATWFKAKRNSIISSPPNISWLSLFELMNQITVVNVDEHIRLEAVSIMNKILISCIAYSEREKFASQEVFQTVSMLLRRESSLCLRKQAVNLFFKLLNCPKVTTSFCYGSMENNDSAARAETDEKTISSVQEFRVIVDGLVDCLSCKGNCTKKLKLRRSTITVIAYIASLGKAGIGIILNHQLPQRSNILVSILESLISDVELETVDSAQSSEIFRERTLLIREALILLNRLVSHPQFSTTVLQTLTSGRDVTRLTINVAKRLCHTVNFLWQDDSITRQIRESEITELARLFERKVFTFLGDDLS